MSLVFPNRSRSFQSGKNRVRFWGYDSVLDIAFFVEAEALMKICPGSGWDESKLLDVFDNALDEIRRVADKVYKHRRERSYVYVLAAKDF